MSGALAVLASMLLAASHGEPVQDPDKESMRFADALVTSYSCELLGYEIDYGGITAWGSDIQSRMFDVGIEPEEAMRRMQADVRTVRNRFSNLYFSIIPRWRAPEWAAVGGPDLGQFIHVFSRRCDTLVEQDQTAAFFRQPDQRISVGDLVLKLGERRMQARHSVTPRP